MKYSLEIEVFRGNDGEDRSRGWPVISKSIRKKAAIVLPHTKKLSVFIGGSESRRTGQGMAHRIDNRCARAEKTPHASWAQAWTKGSKGSWKSW